MVLLFKQYFFGYVMFNLPMPETWSLLTCASKLGLHRIRKGATGRVREELLYKWLEIGDGRGGFPYSDYGHNMFEEMILRRDFHFDCPGEFVVGDFRAAWSSRPHHPASWC